MKAKEKVLRKWKKQAAKPFLKNYYLILLKLLSFSFRAFSVYQKKRLRKKFPNYKVNKFSAMREFIIKKFLIHNSLFDSLTLIFL